MVQFSPSVPADLSDAFKNLDTKKLSDQGTIDLFKQALQHVDEITFVDKEKFIAGIKEKAKDNPELKKLAIKILLEAGNKERKEIDEKLDALKDSEGFLEKYETFQNMFRDHPDVSSSTYLELCTSPVEVTFIQLVYSTLKVEDRTPEAVVHINKALQDIRGYDFHNFSKIIEGLPSERRAKFIQLVSQLDHEEVKILCSNSSYVSDVLDWGEDAFKNFYNNVKIATIGMTSPPEKAQLIYSLYWEQDSGTQSARSAVFSKNVGDLLRDIDDYSIRSKVVVSLLNIPNDERDENLKQSLSLAKESGYGFSHLSSIIDALNIVHKEQREKAEEYYLPLMKLVAPIYLTEAINIFNECPPEKLPELIDLAKSAKQEGLDINYAFLKALSITPEIADETFSLIKQCSDISFERTQLMKVVSQSKNKEEIPQILKNIITLKNYAIGRCYLDIIRAAETISLTPSENRESAIAILMKLKIAPIENPLLVLGCFSSSSQEKLGNVRGISLRDLFERDPTLKEEFTKNVLKIIQNSPVNSLRTIINFLDDVELWMPSFAETILKKDMSQLSLVIEKGLDDEIVNYVKTEEGLRQLAKVASSFDLDAFLLTHFTIEEITAIAISGKSINAKAVEMIASPDVFAYLSDVGLFIKPNIKLTSRPPRHEPLSTESKNELHHILGSRIELAKRDWKEIQYSQEMIDAIRPGFDDLMKQVLSYKRYNEDKNIIVEGKVVTLYQEELNALYLYTSQNYLLINGILDNDETSLSMWCEEKFHKKLDKISPSQKLQLQNAILALDPLLNLLASAINKLPIETHPIYRGDALPESELANWKIGKVFATSKIFSCSIHPSVSEGFARESAISYMEDKKEKYKPVIYIIDSKSSHDISSFSTNKNEDERSYLPNQCFQVQGIDETTRPGLAIIYLSEVDPERE